MVTIADIAQHIAQELQSQERSGWKNVLREGPDTASVKIRNCITRDVEGTELRYLQRYGQGHTCYFRLHNYEQGQRLITQLFDTLGSQPDLSQPPAEAFPPGEQLYLFIHLEPLTVYPGGRRRLVAASCFGLGAAS